MKKICVLIALLGALAHIGMAQGLSVNTTGSAADASAMLDVSSTTQGVLVPRMTAAQMTAISNPATGLLVYQTDAPAGFYFNTGTPASPAWTALSSLWTPNSGTTYLTSTSDNVNIGSSSAATEKLEVNGNIKIPATNDYKYAGAKTHYLSIPGAAFQPEGTTYVTSMIGGDVYIASGNATIVGYIQAPVNLPDGATVTNVTEYVVDNDGIYNLQNGQLWRSDASTATSYGNQTQMANLPLPASTNSTLIQVSTTSSITAPVIDNQNYLYWFRFGMQQSNSNMRLIKVLITYTVTKAE